MEIFFRKRIFGIFVCIVVSGCAVGPNFHEPPYPVTNRYTEKPISRKTASAVGSGGQSQKLIPARDIPAEWWALFHSPSLNRLVLQGIDNNPNLQAALAALRQAEQNLRAGEGQLFPAVGLTASATRERFSSAQFGNPQTATASQSGTSQSTVPVPVPVLLLIFLTSRLMFLTRWTFLAGFAGKSKRWARRSIINAFNGTPHT